MIQLLVNWDMKAAQEKKKVLDDIKYLIYGPENYTASINAR